MYISEEKRDFLLNKSREILHKNDKGGFTVPTVNGLYPAQWNWDSAFVSLAFVLLGEVERGWQEVDMLLAAQWENGMVPHIVFHIDDSSYFPNSRVWQAGEAIPSSGISQPPVLATFVRRIVEHLGEASHPKLREVFPKLFAYSSWYHRFRTHNGLIKILHPWESGFDNNQAYDEALYNVPTDKLEAYHRKDTEHAGSDQRPHNSDYDHFIALLQFMRSLGYDAEACASRSPFQFLDIGVSSMLLRADRDLLALAHILQQNKLVDTQKEQEILERGIQDLTQALETRWTPELSLYAPYDICADKAIAMPSITGMLPLFGLERMEEERLKAICGEIQRWMSSVRYGLPCFDPEDSRFEPYRYCRGPAWPVWSWLVAEGLRDHGKLELAQTITNKSLELLDSFDFFEFFHPHTGRGGGGSDFSWSAAMAVFFLQAKHF